jgi:hypothetical protein
MSSPFTASSDPALPDALLALLLSTDTFQGFLHELTLLTLRALPKGSMCGVTITHDSRPATIASSNQLTRSAGTTARAVALALKHADQTRLTQDLQATLAWRSVIDQAIGILMAQERCPASEAFAILSRASQNRNLKLRDLAAEIVTTVGGRNPDHGSFDPPG